jgi:anthranilate/para-aminobenzoate synthase component I
LIEDLARALFSGSEAARDLPFWADGGPGRQLLTAYPASVERARIEELRPRELVAWLRERLPSRPAPGWLTVVGMAYDAGRNLESWPEITPREAALDALPDLVVARYPAYLEAPSEQGPWALHAGQPEAGRRLVAAASRPAPSWPEAELPRALRTSMSPEAHRWAMADVLEGIRAGDLYQANLARRLEAPFDPRATPALYVRMRRRNPAAFGLLWALDAGSWLASSSPECRLTFDPATRVAHSYPIKGTRPRSADAGEDLRLARDLAEDPKERAEHVMIVDLVRNDLGRVAEPGSVEVRTLLGLQTLPTLHHLVSDVVARVRSDAGLAEVLAALFPGGSVTGAPKIAAMARIERVERLRRGFYTGSVGVIDGEGRAVFNLLIRTAVVAGGRLFYQTGGGIVADSDPEREWRETELKAQALLEILADPAREPCARPV